MNDDSPTCEIINEPVKFTAYDRRRAELREAAEKRDAIAALPKRTQAEEIQLIVLEDQVTKAKKRFDQEVKRGADDAWRRWRDIDSWRAGIGQEEYNEGRRKVRKKPNEDLSNLSADQKEQRKKDQRADANWTKARVEKGWTEDQITAALAVRVEARLASRLPVPDNSEMERDPTYGMF